MTFSPPNRRSLATRWLLGVILLGFAGLSFLYGQFVPPFEGPDEPEHFAYIVWLAEGRGFPPQGERAWLTPVRQEASQPPLYYWLASLPARLLDLSDPPAAFRPNPHFPSNAPGTIPDNKNVAIHYPSDTQPLGGGWLALYLSRTVSLMFAMLLIVSVYGLMRQVAPDRPGAALAAALLVAAIPQVLFMASIVSNDVATAATSALTLWLLAILVRSGPSLGYGLALGVAFGLVALTKTSGLVLALPIGGALFWLWWSKKDSGRQVLLAGLGVLSGALLVSGWWYARSWILYETPLGLDTHYQAPWALSSATERIAPPSAWLEVFFSFWAAFGWGNIKFPGWVYWLLAALVLIAGAGLGRSAWRRWRSGRGTDNTALLVALLSLTILAVSVALELWMRRVTAPHGRLLFPALAAAVVLLSLGWIAIHPWFGRIAIVGVATLAVLSPFLLIEPAYAGPHLDEDQTDTTPIAWRFGQIAELQSVTLDLQSAAAGDELPVNVCWRALATPDSDYSILVHIVGPQDSVVAGRHTYPGLGSYPSSTWKPAHTFCDEIRVDIPADLEQTLQYKVEIGLFDSRNNQRLPVTDSTGEEIDPSFVGAVRLQAAEPAEIAQAPAGDDAIRLVEGRYAEEWLPGTAHTINLQWWLADEVDQDYTVFIHLRDQATGDIVAQGDGPPVDGWYPTSLWTAGEVVEDEHIVTLPVETPTGAYDLVVGWYDLNSGSRLGDEHWLGPVEVLK